MTLPNGANKSPSWAIAEIAPDFKLLDVWALPVTGTRAEFDSLIELFGSFDPSAVDSTVVRALFTIRQRVGQLLGWDDGTPRPIPGSTESTLSARLPDELRGSAGDAREDPVVDFTPLYRTDQEWAAEISNATVHGVVHLAWVHLGGGRYGAEMGIYVKPRGALGELYLKLINPFRHLVVYPALMRQLGRAWAARTRPPFAHPV